MKKILLFLMIVLASSAKAASLPTTDYLYASALGTEGTKIYFDVYLSGTRYYTAVGLDIQLPEGLEVAKKNNGNPNVKILKTDESTPLFYDDFNEEPTDHTLASSFPTSTDATHLRAAITSNTNTKMGTTSGALFRVYVTNTCTSNQWPIGAIKFYKVELTEKEENKPVQPYNAPDKTSAVVMYDGESTLPLSVSASTHWSTCILPFAADIPTGVKAYTSSTASEGTVYLTEAASIEAFTPYVLYSETGYSGTVTGTTVAANCPSDGIATVGNLKGAACAQSITEGYVLQKLNSNVMFYAVEPETTFNIPAGKCWMDIQNGSNAKSLTFAFDYATGINTIKGQTNSNVIYNIQGMKVDKQLPGNVYIVNGKKVIKNK